MCTCNAGYVLNRDERRCDGVFIIWQQLTSYYVLLKQLDINECSLGTDQCSQGCQNIAGSYTCNCSTGYRLNTDGRGCDGEEASLVTFIIYTISSLRC